MTGKVAVDCGGCGRHFEFEPTRVKAKCLFCGQALVLPEGCEAGAPPPKRGLGKVPGAKVRAVCPLCGKSRAFAGDQAGRQAACLFCRSPYLVPVASGAASLLMPDEEPATELPLPAAARETLDGPTQAIVWLLELRLQRGNLGRQTAQLVGRGLERLLAPQRAASPFDLDFTAAVLKHAVFSGLPSQEEEGDGYRLVSLGVGEAMAKGESPGGRAAGLVVQNAIGLGLLALTGYGFTVSPGGEEEVPVKVFLDILLKPEGAAGDYTELLFAGRDETGKRYEPEQLLNPDFPRVFPGQFRAGAKRLLLFQALYAAGLPGFAANFLTAEAVGHRLAEVNGGAHPPPEWENAVQDLLCPPGR